MSEEKIIQIAFAKYPEDKFWIGSGESERLYDQNERDRNKFIEGFKEALKYSALRKTAVSGVSPKDWLDAERKRLAIKSLNDSTKSF